MFLRARRAGSAGALSTQVTVSSSGYDADQRFGAADPPPKMKAIQSPESESFVSKVT